MEAMSVVTVAKICASFQPTASTSLSDRNTMLINLYGLNLAPDG